MPEIRVQLQTPDQRVFEGRCADLESSDRGLLALVEFDAVGAPALSPGEKTKLTFQGSSTIDVEARTVLRADHQERRNYSFRLEKVSKSLLMLLADRRGSVRHRPEAERPVRVHVLGEVRSEVGVYDISATGISILVEPLLERQLVDKSQLQLSIHLRGKEPIEVTATIRHRRLFGSAILYGLELGGQVPDFLLAQAQLLSYITSLPLTR